MKIDDVLTAPTKTIDDLLNGPAAISVPEAGEYLDLKRAAAYQAAAKGIIPTVLVGKRKRIVPAVKLAEILGAGPR